MATSNSKKTSKASKKKTTAKSTSSTSTSKTANSAAAGSSSKTTSKTTNVSTSKAADKSTSKPASEKASSAAAKQVKQTAAPAPAKSASTSTQTDVTNTVTETPTSTAHQVAAAQPAASSSSSGKGLAIIALILSLLAFLAAGLGAYQSLVLAKVESGGQSNLLTNFESKLGGYSEKHTELTNTVANVKSELTSKIENSLGSFDSKLGALSSSVDTLRSESSQQTQQLQSQFSDQDVAVRQRLVDAESTLQAQTAQMQNEFSTITTDLTALKSNLGASIDSWRVQQIEHLLELANQRVRLAGDVNSAGDILRLADEQLAALADPKLADVRGELSREMTALSNANQRDVTGVVAALGALAEGISTLNLANDDIAQTGIASAPAAASSGSGLVGSLLGGISNVVQVERGGEPVVQILSGEERRLIRSTARFQLESAIAAYLQNNGELYAQRMATLQQWISNEYDTENAAVQQLLGRIDELSATKVDQELPDISGSLAALRAALN